MKKKTKKESDKGKLYSVIEKGIKLDNKNRRSRRLWLYLTIMIFAVIVCTVVLYVAVCLIFFEYDVLAIESSYSTKTSLIIFFVGSLVIGGASTLFIGQFIIRHMQSISNAFGELASGNFDVRVKTDQKLEEVREMSLRFNEMAHGLSRNETLSKDFIANISHEFKTPLAAIDGYASLLENENLSPEKRERYLEIIKQNAKRLSKLSSNILFLSKLENNTEKIPSAPFRLDEQIREQILLLESRWSEKEIEFELDLPTSVYNANSDLFAQVWSNLIENAIKHSYTGGRIDISISKGEHFLSVCVRDYGEGMSKEAKERVFEKFYQADHSRESEGNGLGLPLAKRIVELYGGEISLKSEPSDGAEFTVTLPL